MPTAVAAAAAASAWENMAPLQTIASDTLALVKSDDLKGAEKRITDFETEWDASENQMGPRTERWRRQQFRAGEVTLA